MVLNRMQSESLGLHVFRNPRPPNWNCVRSLVENHEITLPFLRLPTWPFPRPRPPRARRRCRGCRRWSRGVGRRGRSGRARGRTAGRTWCPPSLLRAVQGEQIVGPSGVLPSGHCHSAPGCLPPPAGLFVRWATGPLLQQQAAIDQEAAREEHSLPPRPLISIYTFSNVVSWLCRLRS